MSSEPLFRDHPYETRFEARVIAAGDGSVVLDRTLFYPQGGGQPGDVGTLTAADGTQLAVADTRKGENEAIEHRIAPDCPLPAPGSAVTGELDWAVRHARMRMHTCLHLLSVVIHAPVTGGSLSETRGRLDFDLAEPTLEREAVTAELNQLIQQDLPVTSEWITEDELAARPDLVKTMSVRPPAGAGTIRLVRIGHVDLQACGGTHVASTAEIGRIEVAKIEKKSRHNRRVSLAFAATV
ncbi:MAG: alanyl-tRNA editing protein [Halofilum sp. (in: g-proteobacteria)]